MGTIIISCSIAGGMLLLAALISIMIQHSPGVQQKAPKKRKATFWIFFALNPLLAFVLGYFVFRPDADQDYMAHESYMSSLPLGVGIGAVIYLVLGFVLAKINKNGKIGNWF